MARIDKNLTSRLDYGLDWSEWLEEVAHDSGTPDTLQTAVWTIPSVFVVEAEGILNDTIAYFWVSDDPSMVKGRYHARCDIVTTAGRTEHEILVLNVS